MANIKSFPNNQDAYIGAEDVMKWLHGRTSGVFGAGNNVAVAALPDPGMAVTVSDGNGWMSNANADGIVWWNDHEAINSAKLQIAIDAADGAMGRIDRVIVEWSTTNYVDYPEIKVLKGIAKSNPSAPALSNNGTTRQISLAKISIPAGTTKITPGMITDERLNSAVCGIVTESVQVDTSVMQAQIDEFLARIQEELENINAGTAYVLKTGDTMTGPLSMSGNRVSGLPKPTDPDDAANKNYVDSKRFTATATISANWSGSAAPYTQTVNVTGILATDMPHITPVYSDTLETAISQRDAWLAVSDASAGSGSITFSCFEDKPTTAIPIQIEVNR